MKKFLMAALAAGLLSSTGFAADNDNNNGVPLLANDTNLTNVGALTAEIPNPNNNNNNNNNNNQNIAEAMGGSGMGNQNKPEDTLAQKSNAGIYE